MYKRANILDSVDDEILKGTIGFAPSYVTLHMPYISFVSYWLCELRALFYRYFRKDKAKYFTIRHQFPVNERREFDLSFIYHFDNHPDINLWSLHGFVEHVRFKIYMKKYGTEIDSISKFFNQKDFTEDELNFFRRYTSKFLFDTRNEHKDKLLYKTFHRGEKPIENWK